MASYNYHDIANQIELLPIRAFQMNTDFEEAITAFNLEAESSLNIDPITKSDDAGKQRVLKYRFNFKAYLPYNRFNDNSLIDALDEYESKGYTLIIGFGEASMFGTETHPTINATHNMHLSIGNVSHVYRIEQVELRPRLIIDFNGLISKSEIKNLFS